MSNRRTTPPSRQDLDWTAEEDAQLTEGYPRVGAKAMASVLDRHSVHAIRKRAERMKLVRAPSKGHSLSKTDIHQALVTHRGSVIKAAKTLGVPATSLRRRAEQCGIPCTERKPHWAGSELARLRAAVSDGTPIDLKQFPGRTRGSIQRQIRRMRRRVEDAGVDATLL